MKTIMLVVLLSLVSVTAVARDTPRGAWHMVYPMVSLKTKRRPPKHRCKPEIISVRMLEKPSVVKCVGFIGGSTQIYDGKCQETTFEWKYTCGKKSERDAWQFACLRKLVRSFDGSAFLRVLPNTWGFFMYLDACFSGS